LADKQKIKQEISSIIEQRDHLLKVLDDIFCIHPTEANFVLIEVDDANKGTRS
jgi:histidinol-phosphate aminotransferase